MFLTKPVKALKAAFKWNSEMVKRAEIRPEKMDDCQIFPLIETTSVDATAPEVVTDVL